MACLFISFGLGNLALTKSGSLGSEYHMLLGLLTFVTISLD